MIGFINRIKLIARRMPFVDYIYDFVNAILTLQETGGTFTSDGAENIVYIENSPLGVFKARELSVNFDNMAAGGDSETIRVYYRQNAGGALELGQSITYTGVDGGLLNSKVLDFIALHDNRFGFKITEQRVGLANDYAFDWSVTEEA